MSNQKPQDSQPPKKLSEADIKNIKDKAIVKGKQLNDDKEIKK